VSDQPVQVNLGVAEDMSQYNGPITYLLPIPFSAAGKTHSRITVHTRYYDSAAAPPGKSSVTVFLDSDYNWWENISNDSNRYQLEKQNAARKIIDTITSFRPGFDKKVEVIDVSTPLTRERYTGNWMGAMQAFRPSSNMIRALISTKQRNTIDGLNNFYMAGQWVEPWGGITTAAQSGRKVISLICKHKKIPFFTNIP
jgi:phytoene dehydrogenase-like protein